MLRAVATCLAFLETSWGREEAGKTGDGPSFFAFLILFDGFSHQLIVSILAIENSLLSRTILSPFVKIQDNTRQYECKETQENRTQQIQNETVVSICWFAPCGLREKVDVRPRPERLEQPIPRMEPWTLM